MTPITLQARLRNVHNRAIVPGDTVPVVIEARDRNFVASIGGAKGPPAQSISAALRNAIAAEGRRRPSAYWGSFDANDLAAKAYAALERRLLEDE